MFFAKKKKLDEVFFWGTILIQLSKTNFWLN